MTAIEDNPLVSIIIPCWNAEDYVGKAIESALAQTYANVEVIVIDDGSTDGSLGVIQSFGQRVRWETGPNQGGSSARNRGLRFARGDLIQFLDADDLLHRDKLERMVPIALANSSKIVYCGRKSYNFDSPENYWLDCPSQLDDPVLFAINKIIATCTPLYSIKLLRDINGYREDLACAQDYELHIRLAVCGHEFIQLPEILVTVRRLSGSISHDSIKVLDQMLHIWRATLVALDERDKLDENRRIGIAACVASAGRAYLKSGLANRADVCFAEALAIHPQAIDRAYNFPARTLRRLVGAAWTEKAVAAKRRIFNRSHRPS